MRHGQFARSRIRSAIGLVLVTIGVISFGVQQLTGKSPFELPSGYTQWVLHLSLLLSRGSVPVLVGAVLIAGGLVLLRTDQAYHSRSLWRTQGQASSGPTSSGEATRFHGQPQMPMRGAPTLQMSTQPFIDRQNREYSYRAADRKPGPPSPS
jgi:hypothetical protein